MPPRRLLLLLVLTSLKLGCAASPVQPLQPNEGRVRGIAPGELTASDYSPSLDLLALGYRDGTFEVRSPAPHHLLSSGKHERAIANLALSPDSTRLASVDGLGTLAVSVLESGELRVIADSGPVRGAEGGMVGLSWDASSRRLAVGVGTVVRVIDLETGSEQRAELEKPVSALSFTPDGQRLVAAGTRVEVLNLPSLKPLRWIEIPDSKRAVRITDVRFSPDGSLLGVLMLGGVAFIGLASNHFDFAHFDAFDPVGLRFAPDGRALLFARRAIYLGAPSAKEVEAAAQQLGGDLADVDFRKDGSLLLVGDAQDAELAALLD